MKEFHILLRTLCLTALLCLTATHALAYKIYDGGNIEVDSYQMGNDKILVVTKDVTVKYCSVQEGYALVTLPGVKVIVSNEFENSGTIYTFGDTFVYSGNSHNSNMGTINTTNIWYASGFVNSGTINQEFNPFQKIPAERPTSTTQNGWKEYWKSEIVCGEDKYLLGYYTEANFNTGITDLAAWKEGDGKLEYKSAPTKTDGQQPTAAHDFVGWKDYYQQVCTTNTGDDYTFYAEDEAFTKQIADLAAWKKGDGMLWGAEIGSQCYNLEKENGELVLDEDLTFTDKDAYISQYDFTVNGDITYSRTFKDTNWQALYVPFSMSYDEWSKDFEVAAINNFHEYTDANGATVKTELEVRLVKSGTLKPNTPYLIRAKMADEFTPLTIVLSTKQICKPEAHSISCSSTEKKYTFTGTYEEVTGLQTKGYIFMSGGKLCKASNDTDILSPQRWYLTMKDYFSMTEEGSASAKAFSFDIKVLDEEATGIGEISVSRTPMAEGSKAAYNLQGIRVGNGYRGIVIKNGKKFYKK